MKCEYALKELLKSIEDNSRIIDYGDTCAVSTPFIHSSGEFINVYCSSMENGVVRIHDNGETLTELYSYGVDPIGNRSSRSFILLSQLLSKFHFDFDGWTIFKECDNSELGESVLDAVNLVKSVFDLMYLHQATTTNTFRSLVTRFLKTSDIVFSSDHRERGKTVEHKIDYIVRNPRNQNPVFLHTFSGKRTFDLALRSQFAFQDMKEGHVKFKWIPIINPEDDWNERSLNILSTYSDEVVDWGNKEHLVDLCNS